MAAQADGILVTAGQIYVSSLDAAPREQDIISGVASIDAGEIVADEIETTNLILSGQLITELDSITSLTGRLNANIVTIKQLGIGVNNPVNDFQIGQDAVIINTKANDLVDVNGNIITSNLITKNIIKTQNDIFSVNSGSTNVVTVTGNTITTNLTATNKIVVGPTSKIETVAQFKNGNVVVNNGNLLVTGDVNIVGNVSIDEDLTYRTSENLIVSNAVIQMADGTPSGDYDNALLMTVRQGVEPNVAIGYSVSNSEIIFTKTFGSARDIGSIESGRFIPIDSNTVNIHVYGKLYTEGSVGVANINPAHTLSVGSNVYFDDSGSNVMHVDGNVFIEKLQVGAGGFTSSGTLFQINPGSTVPVVFGANVQTDSIRTTGVFGSGIANTLPTDTLSVGDKVFVNITSANVLTVVGNTVSTHVETDSVFSKGNLDVKATTGQLTLRTATDTSNTTSITVDGDTRQDIRFTTKNNERMRLTNDGKLGIANTNPSEALTVAGNVHVTGSNAVVYGTGGMRMYSVPDVGENRIENIVSGGKGLNFYASQTSTMGTAKMTILETGKVGIGTTQPYGVLHTSGGTVLVNDLPTNRDGYNHVGTPLVISNTSPIENVNDLGNVMEFTRQCSRLTSNSARVALKLGKYSTTCDASRTKLSFQLADNTYNTDTDVMTLLANGKIGIGNTQPEAYLEVKCSGVENPRANGLLVHNHEQGDAIITAQTELPSGSGNAFSSYIQTTGSIYSGWSSGVSGTNGDFRITKNHKRVNDSSNVSIFIDGATRNVGIGTDVVRDNVELYGNVVIGNKLTFGGLAGDLYGNTVFLERSYDPDADKNELVIYKGEKGPNAAGGVGPSRIRFLSSEHVFDTSVESQFTLTELVNQGDFGQNRSFPLRIAPSGLVAINARSNEIAGISSATKLFVGGNIEFGSGGSFTLSGFELLTTTGTVSRNIIRNKLTSLPSGAKRPLTFTHQQDVETEKEFARFDENGNLGIGTTIIGANVHIHSSATTSSDVLKLTSNAAATGTTKTGMLLYLDGSDGGYVRGYHDKTNTRTGLILGATRNGIESDAMYLANSSNVGIGTTNPTKKLHVSGDVQCGDITLSKIHLDNNANIYANTTDIILEGKPTKIDSNLTVTGDLIIDGSTTVDGIVNLNNQTTHVSGNVVIENGLVTCNASVAHKRYAHSFSLGNTQGKNITLNFSNNGLFYAKIIAMLTKSNATSTSTMILEVQGGNGVSIGSKNIFGGTTDIWGHTVTTTTTSVTLTPQQGNNVDTVYDYDISVELISSKGVKLSELKHNNNNNSLKTFSY
jgi:hypothetical protein